MTVPPANWRTDDPYPCCGTALTATDDGKAITVDCPLCGWSDSWPGDHGTEVIV